MHSRHFSDPNAEGTALIDSVRRSAWVTLLCLLSGITGCITSSDRGGVTNHWRSETLPSFEAGITTQSDVLQALGPPSQLIRLEDGSVFYYLTEESGETTFLLFIYNHTRSRTRYDRAIFFFDGEGKLTEFATSSESLDYDADE